MGQPNLQWYTKVSREKQLPPRCPFAHAHRCPRYYLSVAVLGMKGLATSIPDDEDRRLVDKWQGTDLWPTTSEERPEILCPDGRPTFYDNFCPEVSFRQFRWFASYLSRYSNEIDAGCAQQQLATEGAVSGDWRWNWRTVRAMHYSDCPLYSSLLLGVNAVRRKGQIGFVPDGE